MSVVIAVTFHLELLRVSHRARSAYHASTAPLSRFPKLRSRRGTPRRGTSGWLALGEFTREISRAKDKELVPFKSDAFQLLQDFVSVGLRYIDERLAWQEFDRTDYFARQLGRARDHADDITGRNPVLATCI